MLSDDPAKLAEEVEASCRYRRKHLECSATIERAIAGQWYRQDTVQTESGYDNVGFAYKAMMLPALCYARPAVRLDSSQPVTQKPILDSIEMALDDWLERSDFGSQHVDTINQMLSGAAIMMTGLEPIIQPYDEDRGALLPFGVCCPRDTFILDPACRHWMQARYMGHEYFRDLDWLQDHRKQYDFDGKVLSALPLQVDGEASTMGVADERAYGRPETPPRHMVRLCDLWVRELNMIYTLVMADQRSPQPQLLRARDYDGPDDGPYVMFGAYQLDGDPWPISRMQANWLANEELNAQTKSISRANQTYKRLVAVDSKNKELQQAIGSADANGIVPVRDFNPAAPQFMELNVGGAHPEQLPYVQSCRDRWERGMGIQQSRASRAKEKTATESQIDQANMDADTAWIKECVYKGTTMVLQNVTHYFIQNPAIVREVSRYNPEAQKTEEFLFMGGIQPGQENIDWSTVTVSIVNDSMSLQDNQVIQANAKLLTTMAPQWMQMLMTMPAIRVRYIVDQFGESINIKNLFDLLFDEKMMAVAQQQQVQSAAAMQQQGGGVGGAGAAPNPGLGFPANAVNRPGARESAGAQKSPAPRPNVPNQQPRSAA